MCKNMFSGSNKKARLAMIAAAQQQAPQTQAVAERQAEADTKTQELLAQANELQAQQLTFAKEQQSYVVQQQAKAEEIAARPAVVNVPEAAPAAPPAAMLTAGNNNADFHAAEEGDSGVESRRKGRRSLRIDLNAPQVAGGTGLNVPQG